MRFLTVILTGLLSTWWVNMRLPWSPFALYFTTLIFMGSYLCLTAIPLEQAIGRRSRRRDGSSVDLDESEWTTPWSIGLLCSLLAYLGVHATDEHAVERIGLL